MTKNSNETFPLTNVQWAYYIGRNQNYEAGGIATHVYYEIKNEIYIPEFERALNTVIRRHPMLRAIVLDTGEQQILDDPGYYNIKKLDLRHLKEEEQQEYILKRRGELSHHVYDPSIWPMFTIETLLLKQNSEENYMFFSLDMLIADAGSLTLMFQEILSFYENPDQVLPMPSVEFKDYIRQLEQVKSSDRYRADEAYWKEKIKNLPMAPKLPEGVDDNANSTKFRRIRGEFDKQKWSKVKKKLSDNRILSSVFICTCFARALSYHSGDTAFTLNLTLSNRGKIRGGNEVIGDFTSLMLVPIDLSAAPDHLLKQAGEVQQAFIESYSHNTYDGVLAAREAAKYHDIQNQAMFPIVFTSMVDMPSDNDATGVLGELQYSLSQTPQVYLDCQMHEEGDTLIVTWDYLEHKYDENMMKEMFGQFVKTVTVLADTEDGACNHIFQVSEMTKHKVDEYNRTEEQYPDQTLQGIVEHSLQIYKDNIAVIDAEDSFTYGQLDLMSKRYSTYLAGKGIGPGDFVGVKGVRTAWTIAKIIGIIKCGAAYVPIHPDYPKERRDYILTNCGCKEYFEDDSLELSDQEVFSEYRTANAKDTAYIIHTSGSTGRPKGVVISNEAVVNTLYDINQRFRMNEEDRILGISDYGFDLSVYDIFGSMLCGASMVIAKEPRDVDEVRNLLVEQKITVWNSVPAFLEIIADGLKDGETITTLKTILLSGDWIPLGLFGKIQEKFPNGTLISLGGATEASIWSIYFKVEEIKSGWSSIPYGYPLSNQNCYVLDKNGELCPEEVKGEIYIGGKGIADGYVNDEKQTAERFVLHPVYGRLYRTGDLGIFRKGGYIDILGRMDEQVKVNGYRIETGEIETVLEEHSLVKKAYVDVRKIGDRQQIIAYLVPQKEEACEEKDHTKILEAGYQYSKDIPEELIGEGANGLDQDMDRISLEVMKHTVKRFYRENSLPDLVTLDELMKTCGILNVYQKLLDSWFFALVNEGAVKEEQGKYNLKDLQVKTVDEMKNELRQLLDRYTAAVDLKNSNYKDSLIFFEQCMTKTVEVLRGDKPALQLLFPEGSLNITNNLYRDSPSSKYFNRIIAELAKKVTDNVPKDTICSILEVGAGTGGATYQLLDRIQNDNVTFEFTDLTNFFISQAKDEFQQYDFMTYGIYDLDQPARFQGYQPESYDLILASNVMHDTKDVKKSLKELYELLKPGGMILLMEITKETYLHMVTFELLEGYSSYDDFRLKQKSALMDEEGWISCLCQTGYKNTVVFPPKEAADEMDEHIIVAFKENVSRYLKEELDEVKTEAATKLASYMIPKEFVQMAELPLSANGKMDKKRLPDLFKSTRNRAKRVLPENDTEENIHEQWSELVGHSEFGTDEDFFQIGGDSLLMIKFLAKMNAQYDIKLEVKNFITNPSIQYVSKYITSEMKKVQEVADNL